MPDRFSIYISTELLHPLNLVALNCLLSKRHKKAVSSTLAGLGRGRAGRTAPPMGPNSFIFAYIFTEKCPCWRSTPPPNGCTPPYGKSWIRHCSILFGNYQIKTHFRQSHPRTSIMTNGKAFSQHKLFLCSNREQCIAHSLITVSLYSNSKAVHSQKVEDENMRYLVTAELILGLSSKQHNMGFYYIVLLPSWIGMNT